MDNGAYTIDDLLGAMERHSVLVEFRDRAGQHNWMVKPHGSAFRLSFEYRFTATISGSKGEDEPPNQ